MEESTSPEQQGINNIPQQDEYKDVIGVIIERRSMGRNLAFVEMQLSLPSLQQPMSIIFRRDEWSSDKKDDNWDAFPVKSTALPYGARIRCWLRPTPRHRPGSTARPQYAVMAWKILEHPKEVALKRAVTEGSEGRGGISYSCLLYTSPSPRDLSTSRMPSSA